MDLMTMPVFLSFRILYKGPDMQVPYDLFLEQWRAFNYTYIVIYPPERREQVLQILGLQAYDNFNDHHAANIALGETQTLEGAIYILPGTIAGQTWCICRTIPQRRRHMTPHLRIISRSPKKNARGA